MPTSSKYIEITCATCGKRAMKRDDFVKRVESERRKLVCSRKCAVPYRAAPKYKEISFSEYTRKNRKSICKSCDRELPIYDFIKHIDSDRIKFRKSWFCKECRKQRPRLYMLKSKYGMEDARNYDRMLVRQKGRCKICHKEMQRPCIDHDHETGIVRDLLCIQCNALIGNAFEDIATLKSAITYLKRWKYDPTTSKAKDITAE